MDLLSWLRTKLGALFGQRQATPLVKWSAYPSTKPQLRIGIPGVAAALPSKLEDLDIAQTEFAEFADRAFQVASPEEAAILERVNCRLAAGKFQVPVLPDVQVKALEIANDPNASADAIAEVIRRDVGVTTEVISLVNSVAYRPASPISDLQRAIVHVGTRRVRGLMFGVAMRMTVFRKGDAGRARQLWAHSMGAALCAREIAKSTGQDPDEAFLAGLLHDVGKSVIFGLLSDEERSRPGTKISDALLWNILEGAHTSVGGQVAKSWGLTNSIAQVLDQHHLVNPQSTPLVATVGLADQVCRRYGIGTPPLPVKFTDNPAFAILKLGPQPAVDLLQRLPEIVANDKEYQTVKG